MSAIPRLQIDPLRTQTNMVFVDVSQLTTAREFHQRLLKHQVEVLVAGPVEMRLVTHRHITDTEVDQTVDAFRRVVADLRERGAAGPRWGCPA